MNIDIEQAQRWAVELEPLMRQLRAVELSGVIDLAKTTLGMGLLSLVPLLESEKGRDRTEAVKIIAKIAGAWDDSPKVQVAIVDHLEKARQRIAEGWQDVVE